MGAVFSAIAAIVAGDPKILWLLFVFPWLALLVMTVGWIKGRRYHKFWPIAGTITGVCATIFTYGLSLLFTWSAVMLAIYLVYFHTSHRSALGADQE